jgi:hypothetical protein
VADERPSVARVRAIVLDVVGGYADVIIDRPDPDALELILGIPPGARRP